MWSFFVVLKSVKHSLLIDHTANVLIIHFSHDVKFQIVNLYILQDLSKDIRQKEQDSQKQFIQRLFPEIVALKSAASNEDWQQEFGRLIENYLENLKKKPSPKKESVSDDSSLRLQVVKYKNIIDETVSQLIL